MRPAEPTKPQHRHVTPTQTYNVCLVTEMISSVALEEEKISNVGFRNYKTWCYKLGYLIDMSISQSGGRMKTRHKSTSMFHDLKHCIYGVRELLTLDVNHTNNN